ncbi:hypothetical protein B0H13DRAFT_2349567 [Mycena leptocephala]|nr:hypothetical protein B0H13DRAFT_2349567 [Mycena leptocephala]
MPVPPLTRLRIALPSRMALLVTISSYVFPPLIRRPVLSKRKLFHGFTFYLCHREGGCCTQLLCCPPPSLRIVDGRHISLDPRVRRTRLGAVTAISPDRLHHDYTAHDVLHASPMCASASPTPTTFRHRAGAHVQLIPTICSYTLLLQIAVRDTTLFLSRSVHADPHHLVPIQHLHTSSGLPTPIRTLAAFPAASPPVRRLGAA